MFCFESHLKLLAIFHFGHSENLGLPVMSFCHKNKIKQIKNIYNNS